MDDLVTRRRARPPDGALEWAAEVGAPIPARWCCESVAASRAETDLVAWHQSYDKLGPADLTLATVQARFDAFVRGALASR